MRMTSIRTAILTLTIGAIGAAPSLAQTTPVAQVRRLTVDEAVRLALDNNLGIQIARYNPQVQDLSVALARSAWTPNFTTVVQGASTATPNSGFLSGATTGERKTTNGRMLSNVGVVQQTPWGGSYSVGWDSVRSTTTNVFSSFSPQLQSSLSIDIRQPLLRNFAIDNLRQQVILSEKDRESADFQLQQTVATTTRAVRNAYFDLAYANASLAVGYGYTGILVAFLARHHPLAIIPVAVLLGGIGASGGLLQRRLGLPDATALVLQGILFVVILASETLRERWQRLGRVAS